MAKKRIRIKGVIGLRRIDDAVISQSRPNNRILITPNQPITLNDRPRLRVMK